MQSLSNMWTVYNYNVNSVYKDYITLHDY